MWKNAATVPRFPHVNDWWFLKLFIYLSAEYLSSFTPSTSEHFNTIFTQLFSFDVDSRSPQQLNTLLPAMYIVIIFITSRSVEIPSHRRFRGGPVRRRRRHPLWPLPRGDSPRERSTQIDNSNWKFSLNEKIIAICFCCHKQFTMAQRYVYCRFTDTDRLIYDRDCRLLRGNIEN